MSHRRKRQSGKNLTMIRHRANAQIDTAIAANADKPPVIYLRRTPVGIAFGCIAVALALVFVAATTLFACAVYPLIWLCLRVRLRLAKHAPPFGSEAGQKHPRRFRLSNLVPGR